MTEFNTLTQYNFTFDTGSGLDGWTISTGSSAGTPNSGGVYISASSVPDTSFSKTLTGLTVGREYTLEAVVRWGGSGGTGHGVVVGVDGLVSSAKVTSTTLTTVTVTFVATADTHVLSVKQTNYGDAYVKSAKVTYKVLIPPVTPMDDLRVEVQVPTPGLQNLIKNPSGEQGGWGWVTPVTLNTMQRVDTYSTGPVLQFKTNTAAAARFESELLPIAAGRYAVAGMLVMDVSLNHGVTFKFEWYNSSKVLLSTSTPSAQTSGTGRKYATAALAPASTVYMKLVCNFYNLSLGTPTSSAYIHFKEAMVATSTTSTGFGSVRDNLMVDPAGTNPANWTSYHAGHTTIASTSTAWNGTTAISLANAKPYPFAPSAYSTDMPVTAGQPYTFSAHTRSNGTNRAWAVGVKYRVGGLWDGPIYLSNGVVNSTTYTRLSYTVTAPAGADMARMVLHCNENIPAGELHFFDGFLFEPTNVLKDYFDGSTTNTATATHAWTGTANASKSTETISSAGFDYQPPYAWQPITGSVTNVEVDREVMNTGFMSVGIKDNTLDPSLANAILKPGKQVRLQARDRSNNSWVNLFVGKISNAHVDYDKMKKVNAVVDTTISITAVDGMSDLANQGENRSVAAIAELPYILEGKGVPWNVNGVTSHIGTVPIIPVVNENLSIADQVVITRDTNRGLSWIDKNGVLQVKDNTTRMSVPAYALADKDELVNYMPNPGFEQAGTSTFDIYEGGSIANSTLAARTGTSGLRATASGTGAALNFDTYNEISIPVHGTYTISFWVRTSVAGGRVKEAGNSPSTTTTLTAANTWYQHTKTVTLTPTDMKVDVDIYCYKDGTNTTPANGTTFDFDDFQIVQGPSASAVDGSYSEIEVDWDTDYVINHVVVKHLTIDADGKAEEVAYGPYENSSSVSQYGAKKAEYTIVGSTNIATYASNILAGNSVPQIRCTGLTVPIKDTKSLAFAVKVDVAELMTVNFDTKVNTQYRIASLRHRIDAKGWFVDMTFDVAAANAVPQYTPAPPTNMSTAADPVGQIIMYAGTSTPFGWLKCEGQSVAVATYPDLHAVVGYTFGGSGANFNVPDFKARSPIGIGGTADTGSIGNAYGLGQKYGHESPQQHTHTGSGNTSDGTTTFMRVVSAAGPIGYSNHATGHSSSAYSDVSGINFPGSAHYHTYSFTTSASGTGNAGNLHPVIGMNFIIRAVR